MVTDNDTSENLRKYYDAVDRDEKNITEYSDNVLKAYIAFRDDIKRELII